MRQTGVIGDIGELSEDEEEESVQLGFPCEPEADENKDTVNDERPVRHRFHLIVDVPWGGPVGRAGRPPRPTKRIPCRTLIRARLCSGVTRLTCRLPTRRSLWSRASYLLGRKGVVIQQFVLKYFERVLVLLLVASLLVINSLIEQKDENAFEVLENELLNHNEIGRAHV